MKNKTKKIKRNKEKENKEMINETSKDYLVRFST
jgi:hypothetical protein